VAAPGRGRRAAKATAASLEGANRAALERVEARAHADIAAAEREALASRDLPFTDADATDGVYEIP
jgi:hypothetical protein